MIYRPALCSRRWLLLKFVPDIQYALRLKLPMNVNYRLGLHAGSQSGKPIRRPAWWLRLAVAASCAVVLLVSANSLQASNLQTSTVEAIGADWTTNIWQTNGTGALVGPPVSGNTYEAIANGIAYGQNTGTRLRGPQGGSNAASVTFTFPGDSLTLDTNTEFLI